MYQPFRYLFMYVVVGVFLFLASEIRTYYYIILNNSVVQLKVGRPAKLRSYSACLSWMTKTVATWQFAVTYLIVYILLVWWWATEPAGMWRPAQLSSVIVHAWIPFFFQRKKTVHAAYLSTNKKIILSQQPAAGYAWVYWHIIQLTMMLCVSNSSVQLGQKQLASIPCK